MRLILLTTLLFFIGMGAIAQPSNDNPCSAISLTVGSSCTYAGYTNAAATASAGVPAPGCASYSGGDVWFSVTVPANGQVTVDMNTGVVLDSGLGFYTGTCGALTLLSCDDDSSPNGNMSMLSASGLTPGSTLFIRVWEYGNNNNGTFSICASSPPAMTNDDPCSATLLTVGATCSYTGGTTVGSTNTAGVPAPGCASYVGPDVWFRVVVPASGAVQFDSQAGTTTDSGMALYTGACGSLTLVECDDDDSNNGAMSMINASGLTPGATVYIRMWDYGGGTGTFSICAAQAMPCGVSGPTAGTNDFCPTPATLTQGPGTFSASTDVTFSQDQPGNVSSVFCGSIENNSWYQFTATSTSHTFPITSVTGCVSGWGIQAHVYSITYTGGCCTGFTSMSNCYNPGNTTLGTVTATGLTIGNNYMLMIDGNSGDGCEFTISGWTGTGILPVQLTEFSGNSSELGNELNWVTENEFHNDHFDVMYSRDAYHFEKIGTVQGAGTTQDQQKYHFFHQGVPEGVNYYQLKQVDTDGGETNSKLISVVSTATDGLFSVFPNPTKNELTLQFQSSKETQATVYIYDQKGVLVRNEIITLHEGKSLFMRDLEGLDAGVYTLIVATEQSTQQERIIKID